MAEKEYIEREALRRAITCRKVQEMERSDLTEQMIGGKNPDAWLRGFDCGMQQALDIIAATNDPKVVVEVVHGAWERYDDSKYLYCSNCGEPAATSEDVSWHGYCPICGAIMDGKCEAE